jgi:hypothetical protein
MFWEVQKVFQKLSAHKLWDIPTPILPIASGGNMQSYLLHYLHSQGLIAIAAQI